MEQRGRFARVLQSELSRDEVHPTNESKLTTRHIGLIGEMMKDLVEPGSHGKYDDGDGEVRKTERYAKSGS